MSLSFLGGDLIMTKKRYSFVFLDAFLKSCAHSATIAAGVSGLHQQEKQRENFKIQEKKKNFDKILSNIFGSKFCAYCDEFKKGQTMTKAELKGWIKSAFNFPQFLKLERTEGGYMLTYIDKEVYIKKVK